jgi:sugar phosphate isomerase/epimerase
MMNRRMWLQSALQFGALAAVARPPRLRAADSPGLPFTMDLCPGRIGVSADQQQAIDYAREFGFRSVEPFGEQLARMGETELGHLLDALRQRNLVWGAAGLPIDFRRDDERFAAGLRRLPEIAAALQRAGVTRVGTWLSPAHDQLTYLANFRQHATRLRAAADVLARHDLRLGLEYVGPKTSWSARRFPFIHTLMETRELIDEIGRDNVGVVLDSWHWYTAGETAADLQSLSSRDVVAVDLNDAPSGVERDRQIDSRRELPAATGVIDVETFLRALVQIGYDGPVRAEPFSRELNEMDNETALRATADAMAKAFDLVRT